MRLHTDFHDYYDHAVGYGIDEKVHYNRFTTEAEIKIRTSLDRPVHNKAGVLGFCGHIYPFIELRKTDKKLDCDYLDDIGYKFAETFFAFSFEEYSEKEAAWDKYSFDFSYYGTPDRLKLRQFFEDWRFESDEVFLERRVPVWSLKSMLHAPTGTVNPRLMDFGFDRVKDPFTAFQEISMYVANILVEQKETAKIEDKFRIEQHGFDLKTSFRKGKES